MMLLLLRLLIVLTTVVIARDARLALRRIRHTSIQLRCRSTTTQLARRFSATAAETIVLLGINTALHDFSRNHVTIPIISPTISTIHSPALRTLRRLALAIALLAMDEPRIVLLRKRNTLAIALLLLLLGLTLRTMIGSAAVATIVLIPAIAARRLISLKTISRRVSF